MVRAKLASYASRALDPRGFASAPPLRADALESTPAKSSRRARARHAETRNGAREGARRRARARRGRVSADASARDALKVAEALDMSCGSRTTPRVRRLGASERWSQARAEATGKTVRSQASKRRTPGVLRRGQTVSGDEETLARGSTTTRAYSQWRGPRGAPRPRRFPVGKRQLALGPTKTQENGRTPPRRLKSYLARSSGSPGAPRAIFCFLAAAFLSSCSERRSWRSARRPASARRGEEDLARREPWVSWYVPRPRDRPTRVSPRPNPRGRAARPRENTRPATR